MSSSVSRSDACDESRQRSSVECTLLVWQVCSPVGCSKRKPNRHLFSRTWKYSCLGDSKLTHYEVTASRVSPQRTHVNTGDAEFVVGKDVNSVEYFLGSVLACLNSTGTMVARDMNIDIKSVEATVEGEVNYATYRGEEVEDRAGLQGLEVTLSVETEGDADLDAWLTSVKERCPVTDNVENETSLSVAFK